jgi:hypothetical protein
MKNVSILAQQEAQNPVIGALGEYLQDLGKDDDP